MLACIQPQLSPNICLDLMSMHDSIHSSHLCVPFWVNKSHIYRGLEISEFVHQSAKCRTSHTSHCQDPYRKLIRVLDLHKPNEIW